MSFLHASVRPGRISTDGRHVDGVGLVDASEYGYGSAKAYGTENAVKTRETWKASGDSSVFFRVARCLLADCR